MTDKTPAITANQVSATPTTPYNPPISTGTPEWVKKLKEEKDAEPWDVRIIRQAIDLLSFNDGAFWCAGAEGEGYYSPYVDEDGSENDHRTNTDAAHTPFVPFHEAWTKMPEAWVDAMPNGQYQLVTDKVCAIGSIQLLIGGGDDNADYCTIINRLNDISEQDSIVSTNDGVGREAVLHVMQEYVKRHGGREGMILPDFKPTVRLDRPAPQEDD